MLYPAPARSQAMGEIEQGLNEEKEQLDTLTDEELDDLIAQLKAALDIIAEAIEMFWKRHSE
jgi:hypothetical protein